MIHGFLWKIVWYNVRLYFIVLQILQNKNRIEIESSMICNCLCSATLVLTLVQIRVKLNRFLITILLIK